MAKPPDSDFWRDLGPKRLHLSAELLSLSPLPESMVLRLGPGKAVAEPEVNQPLLFCLGENDCIQKFFNSPASQEKHFQALA